MFKTIEDHLHKDLIVAQKVCNIKITRSNEPIDPWLNLKPLLIHTSMENRKQDKTIQEQKNKNKKESGSVYTL